MSTESKSTSSLDHIPRELTRLRTFFNSQTSKSYQWRCTQLDNLIKLISENETAITDALKADLGKPHFEASFTEVISTMTEIKVMRENLSEWMKPTKVPTPISLAPADSYIVKEPYGVALIIGPFNYPFQLILLPVATAFAAGNICCIKPSELTPATTALISLLLPKYLDQRSISIIEGSIAETSALLSLKWDYIFFTGSETVGKIVLKAAAEHLTPVTLELGGKSPCIIHSDADLPLSARRLIWGKYLNLGQTCIAPDYVYVHSSIKQELINLCIKQLELFYTKDISKSPDYGRIVNERHTLRLKSLIDQSKSESTSIVHGGQVIVNQKYIEPTLIQCKTDSIVMKDEIFGPILPFIEYNDINEVINYINSKPKPLALYIFSKNSSIQDTIIQRTSSGGISINDCLMHFANSELPFGGVGSSGIGAYHGKHGFDRFSHSKAVLNKSIYGDAPARYPPYTTGKYKLFRYIASIHRVNSESFNKLFKFILLPIVIAAVAHKLGITIGFKSNM